MQFHDSSKIKRNLVYYSICLAVSIAAFMVLIANELTNTYDGMWKGSYDVGYPWVISIGRWFWPVIGKARLDMSPEPFTTILSLALITLGGCMVAEWFEIKDSWKKYVIVLLSVINSAVCVCLSYRYMSPTFASAYILCIFGIYLIRKKQSIWRIVLCIVFLTLSLGCYQACLGITCLLVLLNIVWMLQNEESWKATIRFLLFSILSVLCACILYKVLWDIVLHVTGITASNYRGADSISFLGIIKELPETFINTYRVAFDYFFTNVIKHNAYQDYGIYKVCLVAVLGIITIVGGGLVYKKEKKKIIPYIICLLLIPPAANVSMIISTDTGTTMIQQTMPLASIIPFLACAVNIQLNKENIRTWVVAVFSALLSFLLLGSFLMVSIDQHIMLVSRKQSITLINRVASELDYSNEPVDGYVFLGKPSNNPLFRKDDLWWRANGYARYGEFFIGSNGNTQSYNGLLRDAGLGIKLNWNDGLWHELETNEEILAMPTFPYDGYCKNIDGITVIKISD